MRNKCNWITCLLVIISILIIAGFSIFKLVQTNNKLRKSIPYLQIGEKINNFDLLDKDARKINSSELHKDNQLSLIFIFSRPCTKCNKNVIYWQRLSRLVSGKANTYGIVMDNPGTAFAFEESANLDFKIYVPENIQGFQERMRIKLNFSQTILYKNGVRYMKLGDLDPDNAKQIIKIVRELIKQ